MPDADRRLNRKWLGLRSDSRPDPLVCRFRHFSAREMTFCVSRLPGLSSYAPPAENPPQIEKAEDFSSALSRLVPPPPYFPPPNTSHPPNPANHLHPAPPHLP